MSSNLHHRVRQHSLVWISLDISSCCSAKICSECRDTCTKATKNSILALKKNIQVAYSMCTVLYSMYKIWFICGKWILFCQNAQALASSLCEFLFFFFFPEVDDDYLNYFSCKRNYLTIYTLYRDHWKVLPECFLLHFVAWMLPLAKIMHVAMHIPRMLSSERM